MSLLFSREVFIITYSYSITELVFLAKYEINDFCTKFKTIVKIRKLTTQ